MIIPITNSDGEHFGGTFGFLKSLKAAVDKFKPSEVVVAWDGPSGGLRRKQLFPEYKAHRKTEWKRGSVRAFDFMSEEEQKDNFIMQLTKVQDYLKVLPIKTIKIPYVEADDIIAVYTQCIDDNNHVIMYSSDADFKQLVTDNVHHYNPIAKKLTTRESFINEYGIEPKNYIILKSTSGDKSDNIPGIRGLGEKTIKKLFPGVTKDELYPLDDLIKTANKIGFSKSKDYTPGQINKYKLIAESADVLRLNYRLMQLIDPEISNQAKEIVTKAVTTSPQKFNSLGLKMMFIQDKLEKTVRRFDGWTNTFAGLQTH